MAEEGIDAKDIKHVEITVPPYAHRLVGHPFQVGTNPKVSAQFSIRYCVANALIRKSSKLAHFEEAAIRDPEVLRVVEKIEVISDPAMEQRGHTALDTRVITKNGKEYPKKIDFVPGFPERPLTEEEHRKRFRDCIGFAAIPIFEERADDIIRSVNQLEVISDVRSLISLLLVE
jgi:2-methylcitrate dehydratase PrpD